MLCVPPPPPHILCVQARDLFLMSRIGDTIHDAEDKMKILYNRVLVMLGLCAFRAGNIHETQNCLWDVCSPRQKELLAQVMILVLEFLKSRWTMHNRVVSYKHAEPSRLGCAWTGRIGDCPHEEQGDRKRHVHHLTAFWIESAGHFPVQPGQGPRAGGGGAAELLDMM
jgi:hypothetical protein